MLRLLLASFAALIALHVKQQVAFALLCCAVLCCASEARKKVSRRFQEESKARNKDAIVLFLPPCAKGLLVRL